MTVHVTHFTASAHPAGSRGQPDRMWPDAELERLELLVPGLDHAAARGLVSTALAYVERYRTDVLQLDHEWDLLGSATLDAWRTGQHANVIRRHWLAGIFPASPREQSSQAPRESLSEREAEVLRLVAAGLANSEIAERLVVTPGTVKKHLEHVYAKLGAHSRTAAVATARALSMLP